MVEVVTPTDIDIMAYAQPVQSKVSTSGDSMHHIRVTQPSTQYSMDTKAIQAKLADFAKERDWDQFHSPKNLSMALAGEAGELLEIFQWLTEEGSHRDELSNEALQTATDELADIQIYVLRLADKLGVDLADAVISKMDRNAQRYTVDKSKGNAIKR